MNVRRGVVLSLAGVVAAASAACSGIGKEQKSDNPTSNQVQESQQQSEQALKQAHDAQKKASDQERKAADAQANVQKLQRELTQAQATARQEQARAQQMQSEASAATQRSAQQTQASQQSAAQGLAQANQQAAHGQLATRGTVTEATPQQLVLKTQNGWPMTFEVTDQTNVRIDGRRASVGEIQQGQAALVSYQAGSVQPRALQVQVQTGRLLTQPQGTGSTSDQGGGPSSTGATGSPPAGPSPSGASGAPQGTTGAPGTSAEGTGAGGSQR